MLSNSIMGVFALLVLWVNTLLVAAAAYQRLRSISRRKAKLVSRASPVTGQSGLFHGVLRRPDASSNVARAVVDQLGRYGAGAGRSILWHDRRYASECLGGSLVVDGVEIALDADPDAEVWPHEGALAESARCPTRSVFEEAFVPARKAKGFPRTVEAFLRAGDAAWVFGEVRASSDGPVIRGTADAPLLVSAIDPVAWCNRKILFLGALFIPAVIVGAAICTAISLWEPHFGAVSMVGGGLSLLYFLLVLPAGTAARDAVREPHRRILEGKWVEADIGPETNGSVVETS